MEHGELLKDVSFLMENCENDYYNKDDLVSLLFDCLNELLELTASHGFEGHLWQNYLTFLLAGTFPVALYKSSACCITIYRAKSFASSFICV